MTCRGGSCQAIVVFFTDNFNFCTDFGLRTPPPPSAQTPPPSWSAGLLTEPWLSVITACILCISLFVDLEHGLGIPCCAFRYWTQLPCPGCGLTRGLGAVTQGAWGKAWELNPFSFAVFAFCTWHLVYGLLSWTSLQPRLRGWIRQHGRWLDVGLGLVLLAWTLFGYARMFSKM
ncbi:MAG TPA: hypothetical protein DCE42_04800 [Myxococcales bacterium]|nr:hypothetical protein [Deltaproteobacteria bacterium]MBU53601.1 hypothetical protein [Deltaproteobacteria bacterium]HAA54048.1 hypothetical protein [Myxococcales bacterium]